MKNFVPLRFLAASAVVATTLFTTGCSTTKHDNHGGSQPSALCTLRDDQGRVISANFPGTIGMIQGSHAANHVNEIQNVKSACCENFDRLVFAVDGIHQPSYTIKYAQPPFTDCGSGNTHQMPGNAWLTIKMTPAQGHGAGQATLPRETSYHCANLKHLSITCDFEADLTFVIGLNAKRPYRVIELQNPTRLVVDIRH
jgi:hypothetical protein